MSENSIIEIKEREILKEKIIELLKKSEDQNKLIAIAINGEWGIGKTYLWKNELAPLIREELKKNPIYISVFGKKDEQAIIEDLVTQFLSVKNQQPKSMGDIVNGALSLFGINVNIDFLFKMFKKEYMENTIVCIDEFERLSDKIPVQDILGLISELKEHKRCCVIAIYNKFFTDEVKDEQKKLFNAYCEKVFDRMFNFSPYAKEQIEAMGGHPVKTDFEAYHYMKDILNINHLTQHAQTINLREFEKVKLIYEELFSSLELKEYLDDDFKKIYQYLLYPIVYAYYFTLHNDYFTPIQDIAIAQVVDNKMNLDLFHPNFTILEGVMQQQSHTIRESIEGIKTSASYTPPNELQNWLKNLTNKIIQDTKFHNDFLTKYQTSKDSKKASIEFFLENKDNLKAFPYIFGFRILNYNSHFLLKAVIENHKDECLNLLKQWCDSASKYINKNRNKDLGEYFWINNYTFVLPLKDAFEKLKINLPQNDLITNDPTTSKYSFSPKLFLEPKEQESKKERGISFKKC
ncbi:P-loop NTPase fold protein [Helicobacter pylori]|uniref:P-loop NTPase fold protein n=1 Tax=Helicobacter pylori TaxID=210 RepID=UPI001E28634A|nr:P-loop NTPase fold protein [Helicobacter pylori]